MLLEVGDFKLRHSVPVQCVGKRGDRPPQPSIAQVMGAVGANRGEATQQLVFTAVPRLKDGQAFSDAALDRVVVANFEVQKGHVARLSPVATEKTGVSAQVPGTAEQCRADRGSQRPSDARPAGG